MKKLAFSLAQAKKYQPEGGMLNFLVWHPQTGAHEVTPPPVSRESILARGMKKLAFSLAQAKK